VPVALVRQGEHRAPVAVEVRREVVEALHAHAGPDTLRRPGRERERLAVVAHVRAHARAREAAQRARRQVRPDAREVALELTHSPAVREPRHVGDRAEQPAQDGLGDLARVAPGEREHPAGVEGHQRPSSFSSGWAATSASAWRRTVATRCTIVTALATASSPRTTTSTTGGTPSPTIPAATSAATSRSA